MTLIFRLMAYKFGAVLLLCVANVAWATEPLNRFADYHCGNRTYKLQCHQVTPGQTWKSLFPIASERDMAMRLNRQNVSLQPGQWLLLPGLFPDYEALSPFSPDGYVDYDQVIVFAPHPHILAWALYEHGQRIKWGPAVGGQNYCADVRRGCRTQVGSHVFREAASPARRSSVYPRGCHGRRCAPMPYYMRFTGGGQGMHARAMNGRNASHGCVGVFHEDAEFLNQYVRSAVGKDGYGYFTESQSNSSPVLIVLSYDAKP